MFRVYSTTAGWQRAAGRTCVCARCQTLVSGGVPHGGLPRAEERNRGWAHFKVVTVKRFVIALSLGVMASDRTLAAPQVHIVIPEDGFSDYLARAGAIAAVPVGTLMRISFDYSEYDALHPYLVAYQYCGDNQFLKWGAAPHPSLGDIDLVCVRGAPVPVQALATAGN